MTIRILQPNSTARPPNVTAVFALPGKFFKTSSLHLDLIYMYLVGLGSFFRANITHFRASWASSTSRHQVIFFKVSNHQNPSSYIFHLSSSMFLGWFHIGFSLLLTWLVSRTSFSHLYVLALQDNIFITWIDSRVLFYDLTLFKSVYLWLDFVQDFSCCCLWVVLC